MGMINIEVVGSFRDKDRVSFSAYNYGHTDAVENAIEYLKQLHVKALAQDLSQGAAGDEPFNGFGETVKSAIKRKE